MCRFTMLGAWHYCSPSHIRPNTSLNEAIQQATKVILLFLWKATWACLAHFREERKPEAKQGDIQSLSEMTQLIKVVIIKILYRIVECRWNRKS